ncbi:adhesin [Luteimonas yindakuii]|uniref:Adhesin n=1 Tax=Luteimonas yindakuii TaxID=2565782 RepID=A0A4Z1REC4_9GAMM|nr:adhesin [Luteimonas yindakuii]QCO66651.2 adhesin [Luteimonas yindakuii]TKS55188.1 adhesin [Luteimonas yindakuii]
MNTNLKRTALALAVASFAFAANAAEPQLPWADVNTAVDTDISISGDIEATGEVDVSGELVVGGAIDINQTYDYTDTYVRDVNIDENIVHDHTVTTNDDISNTVDNTWTNDISNTVDNTMTNDVSNTVDNTWTNDVTNSYTNTTDLSTTVDIALSDDRSYEEDRSYVEDRTYTEDRSYDESISREDNRSYDENVSLDVSQELDVYQRVHQEEENVNVDSNIRRERNEHGRTVYLSKNLSLDSDISFSGDIALSGDLEVDSAAIAVVDGRQTIVNNEGNNDMLANDASISDDAASGASGNLGFNVAAGDNNAQDNAAALSAADAAFSFGMSDAEIFNNQLGANNATDNEGVTNDANMGGNAFNGASGNIAVNIAAGNNNAQRNSLAASVSVAGYAQASVASDQVSTGNVTNNMGMTETREVDSDFSLNGTISAGDGAELAYAGRGNAYQQANMYPDSWGADENDGNHESGPRLGHIDLDSEMQGAVDNPYRDGVGGLAFDTDEEGIIDLSELELDASLSGAGTLLYEVDVQSTNTASLDGSAFSGASGNIGVNIAAGTGNLQSNSLALAVAQPGGNGGGGGGGE